MKKENRLRLSRHIKRAYNKGIGWQGDFFRVKAFKNSSAKKNPGRLAVIVSKKFSNLATKRNLFRRRLRSAFHPLLAGLTNWDTVVLAKPQGKDAKFADLEEEVKRCVNELQLERSEFIKKP